MSGYIRTKDGKIIDFQERYKELISLNAICKTKQEFNKKQKQHLRSIYYSEQWKTLYVFDYGGFYMLDIVKQADTIEELCDEFVGISDGKSQMLRFVPYACSQYWNGGVYGAIWTDKGLIYIAKMNEEGVLCLI